MAETFVVVEGFGAMQIVDMRLRPPLASWTDKPQYREDPSAYVPMRIGFSRPVSAVQRSVPALLEEMDEAGIQWGVIMGRKSAPPLGVVPNADVEDFITKHPKRFLSLIGIAVGDPVEDSLKEIERYIKKPGFVGVSIEPCCSAVPMLADDKRIYPIYELCQALDVPISICLSNYLAVVSGAGYEFSTPLPLYRVAKDFPKLKIVVSHGAWPWVRELLGVAYAFKNVWVSPDLYLVGINTPGADEYVKAANMYLADRTLFGSAYPTRPLLESIRAFDQWTFAPGVRDRILSENARTLLRIPS